MSEAATALPRDVRVDHIGFCNELATKLANDLKSAVKVRMDNDELTRVTGDYFEGQLVRSTVSVVDPAKLLALWSKDKITRAQLLSALCVKKEPLAQFLTGAQIDAISETSPGTPQLRVTRIKGVELKLVDAVKNLGESIAGAV